MKKCAACAKPARSLSRVFVGDGANNIRRALVCSKCARNAIAIVMKAPEGRCNCGNLATLCAPCCNENVPKDRAKLLKPAIIKLRSLALAYAKASKNDRADGITQAADILEAGNFGS